MKDDKTRLTETERHFALWLRKQTMLSDQMARIQSHVGRIQDALDKLTHQVGEINGFIADYKADISKEFREGHEDVRPN